MGQRLIDADRLKRHYAWWGQKASAEIFKEFKHTFDIIVDLQPTVEVKEDNPSAEEFLEWMRMVENKLGDDTEEFHVEADKLLCEILERLGYGEGVAIFRKHPKWYS